jgi:N-methylhydantoinase B
MTDAPLTVALDLTISPATAMTLDFSRSSPPCAGPINISRADHHRRLLRGAEARLHRRARQCRLPRSRSLSSCPTRRCSAPRAPKPMAGYTETILRVIGVVFGALAKADAGAGDRGALRHHQRVVHRRAPRRRQSLGDVLVLRRRHWAATPRPTGLNHANNPISMATIPPAEILEASYPIMFRQWALRPDSGGEGTHRGGLGAIYEIEALDARRRRRLPARRARPPRALRRQRRRGSRALNRFSWETRTARNPRPSPPRSPA